MSHATKPGPATVRGARRGVGLTPMETRRDVIVRADELEMPCGIWPSDHQQRMSALCGSIGPEQDLKAQAVDPESFGRPQVAARTCDTQMACWQRFHGSIIADVKPPGGGTDTAPARPGAALMLAGPQHDDDDRTRDGVLHMRW